MKKYLAKLNWKWVIFISAAVMVSLEILFSSFKYRVGFPLDDAWIHQTYARNLAQFGEFSFIPGTPSAGSTSPIWTILLVPGHLLESKFYLFWTHFVGFILLGVTGVLAEITVRNLTPKYRSKFPVVGLFFVFEWHLLWAAASGMETLLIACVYLVSFLYLSRINNWFFLGLLAGAAVWIRPDGLTLIGPLLFVGILSPCVQREKYFRLVKSAAGFLILFFPYLFFNQALAGQFWPNTFFAKQAEYAVLLQEPLGLRVANIIQLPMIGSGIFLLPGILYGLVADIRERNWIKLSAFLWWLGYSILYALRLPVTYQHGRYLIPSMPVFFLLGWTGSIMLFHWIKDKHGVILRVIKPVWVISLLLVHLAFAGLGIDAFSDDVAIIESEMVDTAVWVAQNTPIDSLVSAHDIGALGFFGQRNLVDLAGLISPEVIPFIRDEDRLKNYLFEREVEYLIVFPNWYETLPVGLPIVFQTGGEFSPKNGGENMTVYSLINETPEK